MAHRTTDDDSLISSAPSGGRRSDIRSSVFPSPAAQSDSTIGTAFPDTQSPLPAPSLRSCVPHKPVSAPSLPAAGAHRERDTAPVRPTRRRARSGAAPAAADRHHWPVPPLASGRARSDLLPSSPASARQSAETGAHDSKSAIPLQTAPDTLLSTPLFSASVDSRSPSRVLPSWLLLSS